jgi:hypothetical protein
MKDEGYEVEADGRVVTIFSAPNYCDQMKNKGAFIRFKGSDMRPKFIQFNAVVREWCASESIPLRTTRRSRQWLTRVGSTRFSEPDPHIHEKSRSNN